MQLTRAADYAVRVMVHLAGAPPATRASRSELAASVDCPEQFLSKVLQSLNKAGLVISHRGNTGGFELPPGRRHSSVLEIIEAVEGPIRLNVCLDARGECDQAAFCVVYPVWKEAQKALTAVLREATIDRLAEQDQRQPATTVQLEQT